MPTPSRHRLFDVVTRFIAPLYAFVGGHERHPRTVPRRILIVKPDHLGDVVLTTPALTSLAEKFPEAELWYLAKRSSRPVLEGHPAVTHLETFDAPWCCNPGEPRLPWPAVTRLARRMRRLEFDAAVALQDSPLTNLFVALCGIPRRVGYAPRGGRHLLTDCPPAPPADEHAVDSHERLVAVLGAEPTGGPPRLYLSPDERTEARRLLTDRARLTGGFVAFHLGAAHPGKTTSPAKAAAIAQALHKSLSLPVLLLVGPHETSRLVAVTERLADVTADQRTAGDPAFPSFHELSVRQLAAVLSEATVYVGHDSGPTHVAWAVGTPTVALFGPGNPERWGPRGTGTRILRTVVCDGPCSGRPRHAVCTAIEALNPVEVAGAARELSQLAPCGLLAR